MHLFFHDRHTYGINNICKLTTVVFVAWGQSMPALREHSADASARGSNEMGSCPLMTHSSAAVMSSSSTRSLGSRSHSIRHSVGKWVVMNDRIRQTWGCVSPVTWSTPSDDKRDIIFLLLATSFMYVCTIVSPRSISEVDVGGEETNTSRNIFLIAGSNSRSTTSSARPRLPHFFVFEVI